MNRSSNIFRLSVIFVVVMLVQVVVLDNLSLLGLCNPFLYVVFIMSFPFGTSALKLMLVALPAGLVVDIASNTPGMHAASCVLIAFLRPLILRYIAYRSTHKEEEVLSVFAYGPMWYLRYTLIMVSIHHVSLFFIEQFDRLFLLPTLLRVVISIAASVFVIMLFQLFMPRSSSVHTGN